LRNSKKFWNQEKVIKALKSRKARGKSLDARLLRNNFTELYDASVRYFGSYKRALEEAGFSYEREKGRKNKRGKPRGIDFERESLIFRMWDQGERLREIAEQYGVSSPMVSRILKRNGLGRKKRRKDKERVFAELCERMGDEVVVRLELEKMENWRLSYKEIAEELGIPEQDVGFIFDSVRMPRHHGGRRSEVAAKIYAATGTDHNRWLRGEYGARNRTANEIAGEIGVTVSALKLHLMRAGIRKG